MARRRRRKRSGGHGIGIAVMAVGMAAFLGLYAWQQFRTSTAGTPRIAPLNEVLDTMRRTRNVELAERLLDYAETAESNDILNNQSLRELDKAVRGAAKDKRMSDEELVVIANVVSESTTGISVTNRADIDSMLGP